MVVDKIINTKPPYEIYKKDGKQWVKFDAGDKKFDMPAEKALDYAYGLGLLVLALCLCIALAIDNHKK